MVAGIYFNKSSGDCVGHCVGAYGLELLLIYVGDAAARIYLN